MNNDFSGDIIPNGETHEKINLVVLAAAIPCLLLLTTYPYQWVAIASVSYLIGTFYINPDLDTDSRARNRWWIFKFIWKPFRHRGILHNPLLWLAILGVAYYFHYELYVSGVVVSAFVHLIPDWIMDFFHKIGINI